MTYEASLTQVVEPAKKGVGGRECRHINVCTPRLPEYPVKQTERVDTLAKVALQATLGKRL